MKSLHYLVLMLASLMACGAANADTIATYADGTQASNGSMSSDTYTFFRGQSFTTYDDGTDDYLTGIYLLAGTDHHGTGTLYLFTSAYSGTAESLSSATTNLLGTATWNSSSSVWDFSSSSIVLTAGTKYYFYYVPTGDASYWYGSDYSGGEYYLSMSSSSSFSATGLDMNFVVTGTAVPEPAAVAGFAGLAALGFATLKRRRK
jgi:hypothetical protein